MTYNDIRNDIIVQTNFLENLKKEISAGQIRNYPNVLNGLRKLVESLRLLETVLDKQDDEIIWRRVDRIENSITELQDIVSDSIAASDNGSYIKVTERLDNLICDCNDLPESIAGARPQKAAGTEQDMRTVQDTGTKTYNKMLRPTVEEIAEIIQKLRTLKEKQAAFINAKGKISDNDVSEIAEKLDALSKSKQKGETKDDVANMLKTTKQIEVIRIEREGAWPEDIKQLINEVTTRIYTYWDYFKANDLWEIRKHTSIKALIKTGKASVLDNVIQGLENIKYKMEVEAGQLTETEQVNKVGKQKKTKKAEEPAKKFQPWKNPSDACFIFEGNRIKFHYKDKTEDLRLKSESQTHRLLRLLHAGSLQADEITNKISPDTTNKANKIVNYANMLINQKIRKIGFVGVPPNVEFIKKDKFNSYLLSINKHTKEEFNELQCK